VAAPEVGACSLSAGELEPFFFFDHGHMSAPFRSSASSYTATMPISIETRAHIKQSVSNRREGAAKS
jgi:hypothetical protein